MKVTFWGTRGSLPTPMTAGEFRIKAKRLLMKAKDVDLSNEAAVEAYLDSRPLPDAMTFGGNTPCIEVTEGGSAVILDCGSGMFLLGRHMMKAGFAPGGSIDILQTHTHWDHMIGFPFFAPAFTKGTRIRIHGVHPDLRERFEHQMDHVHFPITMDEMAADIEFHQHPAGETFQLGPFEVISHALHHPGGSYSYRITSGGSTVVYATDGEYKGMADETKKPYVEFFRDADVLIFDAMYSTIEKVIEKENFGHSAPAIGLDLARSAGVGTLVLFHHDPECNDTQIAQTYFAAKDELAERTGNPGGASLKVVVSYDGLGIDV